MIAVDTNILVYADREHLPQHGRALSVLTSLAEGAEAWGLPIFCVGEFIRVVSHPRLFDPPTPAAEAVQSIMALLESPSVRLLSPGSAYLTLLERLIASSNASGNLIFDAQIAAVCLEHGARTVLTEDRDFMRFPELTIQTLASIGETRA